MLLIPNYENITIRKNKESDVKLQRNLSMDESVIAFGRYKRIMDTPIPKRNEELDLYLAHIIETANIWPDCFYEYQTIFSAKCTVLLIQHNIKIDWSKGDSDLRNMVCAGSKINTCRKCHSTTHSTVMCSVLQGNAHVGNEMDKFVNIKTFRAHSEKIHNTHAEISDTYSEQPGIVRES
ncbi:unnamed protein product [Mytilus coruscus]|uniref:Uncharacterized protein n=1 Tax=Mytilus coruscus TaxID=42192 RepID=A0A6J7ZVA7_MYTCO|nr:unnamed protein product [Mytilus coruscus]